ncbi:MAG TPA: hypothetical protein VMV49_06005 [Candidatus Deferrimicrobium sp.]|nr:hypothetical protein [Candidatus Deferrimicrobium sp.]
MTTIQISKKTQERLIRIISDYQKKMGRRINYDEMIELILNHYEVTNLAIKQFEGDFGILKGKSEEVWIELRKLKSERTDKLERLTK